MRGAQGRSEAGFQVSGLRDQVMDGGDVTERGEDRGEARVRGLREGKEAQMKRSVSDGSQTSR